MSLGGTSRLDSPPCITKELEDRTVRESTAAKFICHGTARCSACWYKNDEPIAESKDFTMLEEVITTNPNTCQYVLVVTRSYTNYAGTLFFS